MRSRLLVLLALVWALLALAAPASADDLFEIDGRLASAGLPDAYTEVYGAERGVRVIVDYDSPSTTREQYQQEAARAAELVWRHLEEEVRAVDVAPTYGVRWLDGDLPPAVSYSRADLEAAHGPRPAGLDQAGGGIDDGTALLVVGGVVLGLVLAGAVVLVVVLVRRSRRPAPVWGAGPGWGWDPSAPAPAWGSQPAWGQQPAWGVPPQWGAPQGAWQPQQGAWQPQGAAPVPSGGPAPAQQAPAGAADADDVWRPPGTPPR